MVVETRPQLIPKERLERGEYSLQDWQAHSQAERAPYAPRIAAFKNLSSQYLGIAARAFDGMPPLLPSHLRVFKTAISGSDFPREMSDIPENLIGQEANSQDLHPVLLRFTQRDMQYVNGRGNRAVSWGYHERYMFAVRLSILRKLNGESLPSDAKVLFGQEDDFGDIRRGDPFHPDHVAYDTVRSNSLLLLADRLLATNRLAFVYESR